MPANTGVAPVCNAPPQQPTFTQKAPPIPSFSVPNAQNPQSVVTAVLQLQKAIINIVGGNPLNNSVAGLAPGGTVTPGIVTNVGGGFTSSGSSSSTQQNKQPQGGQWREVNRVTENVKIVNPNDSSQFVIFQRITSLTFANSITGENLTWHL